MPIFVVAGPTAFRGKIKLVPPSKLRLWWQWALVGFLAADQVATITMEGDANGAPHPDPGSYAKKFSGKYAHRNIAGGVGHNLPQEAP